MFSQRSVADHEFRFLGQYKKLLAIWLACGLGLVVLTWNFTSTNIEAESLAARHTVQRDTMSLLKSNAEQIGRTIDHIDHLTLMLKFHWRETGSIDLEKQIRDGFFPLTRHFYATLVDRDGNVTSSTLRHDDPINVSTAEYFQTHRDTAGPYLRIGTPVISAQLNEQVVHFTRRLDNADGTFGGVIIVAVKPDYFETFENQALLGPDDCMSVRYVGGEKLAARLGNNVTGFKTLFHTTPAFDTPSGMTSMPASAFVDGKARTVAWQRSNESPLVAAIALEENHLYSAQRIAAAEQKQTAFAVSVLIVLLSIAGAFITAWLSWKKKQAEEIKGTYRLATDNAQEGFFMLRSLYNAERDIADFLIEDCNERGAMLVGFTKGKLVGSCFSDLYTERPFTHLLQIFSSAMQSGFHEDEFRVRHQDKANRWLQRRLVKAGEFTLAMTVRDITESKTYEARLADMANFDALTRLHNRHWLNGFLPAAIDTARRNDKKLALLFIDLDKFKVINDTMGHAIGDKLLMAAAGRIASLLRPGDEAVRIGGDEFTVVLNNVETHDAVLQVTSRLVAALGEPFAIDEHVFKVTASVGASYFPDDGQDAETLLMNADIAMYCAKEEQKHGNIKRFCPAMYERMTSRAQLERELDNAIKNDELLLHYQPRVDTLTGNLAGFEALIRWHHPQKGLVSPGEFIPLAESTGLISAIGDIVIDKACAQLAQWRKQGFSLVPVSVNVSARQFHDGQVNQTITAALQKYQLSPRFLEIEITESAMLGDADTVIEQVSAISKSGVQIHIDDFGTGYSSLSMLHRLNVNVLKIDRAFTMELGSGTGGEALFVAIVSMAKALDMRVVAEGVESEAQRHILRSLHVDEMQGFFIARPMPAADIEVFLQRDIFAKSQAIAA